MGMADKIADYFGALITGVLLLYVLIVVVNEVFKDLPQFAQYGIAIVVAAAGALYVIARKGIR